MGSAFSQPFSIVGSLGAPYSVRGWIWLRSYTEPLDNIFSYSEWFISGGSDDWNPVALKGWRVQGKAFIVSLEGCTSREKALEYRNKEIAIPTHLLPKLPKDEFYYYQLVGLQVETLSGLLLGQVDHVFNTGSNDVLVVKHCIGSIDARERWLPYVRNSVLDVDLEKGKLLVDWDPTF